MTFRPMAPGTASPPERARPEAWRWSLSPAPLHAVMMDDRLPGLVARLGNRNAAAVAECLRPGALTAGQPEAAPWLVTLEPEPDLTDRLLFEARPGFGEWGLLARITVSASTLRRHLRGLLRASVPGGGVIDLRSVEAPSLGALLPLLAPRQRAAFFGPLHSLLLPGNPQCTELSLQDGALQRRQPGGAAIAVADREPPC